MTEDSKRSLRNDVNLIQSFIKKEAMKLNEDASLPAAAISATPASKPSIDTNAPCATCGGSATSSGTPGSSTCTCPPVTEGVASDIVDQLDQIIDHLMAVSSRPTPKAVNLAISHIQQAIEALGKARQL